jgi:O-antigen/teichoic acid export membrane protein
MRADLDFRFTFAKRLFVLFATVTAAYLLHSYWALVIGTLLGRLFGVVLSYQVHPMRARFSIEKLREIFAVSQWMLINSIGNYINFNLHKFLVGKQGAASTMGGYALADEISAMPSSEILSPLNRVLFPAFVRAKHDLLELKRVFLLAQGVQCLIAIPASIGLAFVAQDAVLVLLGEKWLLVVPFIHVLALSNVIQAITTSSGYVLLALGKNRSATLTTWMQVAFFTIAGAVFLKSPAAIDFAWLRVATVFAGLTIAIWTLMRSMHNIRLIEIFKTIIRPLLGTALMGCAIFPLDGIAGIHGTSALLLKIGIGAASYAIAITVMWVASGRPEGAESYLLDKVLAAYKRPVKVTP